MSKSATIYAAAIVMIGFAAYSGSLGNGFTFDDYAVVVNNPVVGEGRLSEVFSTGYWRAQPDAGHYRPLTILSFVLNHAAGGLKPFGYHLTNLVLHLLNATFLFWILGHLLRDPHAAGFGALAFLLHPVNTEAVCSVVGRSELLAAFCVLSAWASYVAASRAAGGRRALLLFASVLLGLMGCLAKEQAALLVGLLVGYDLMVLLKRRSGDPIRRLLGPDLIHYTPYVLTLGLYAVLRYGATGALLLPERPDFVDNHLAYLDGWDRVLSAVATIGHYAQMLVFPHPLTADYAYNAIPAVSSISSVSLLASLMLCCVAAAAVLMALRGRCAPEIGFGVYFVGLFLAPVVNLFFVVGTRFAERLLYLPAVGFGLLVAFGFVHARRRMPLLASTIAALVLLAFALRVGTRTADWRSNLRLFSSAVESVPGSARAHFNMGNALRESGDLDGTLEAYGRALEIYPGYAEVHYNRGVIFQQGGHAQAAARAYADALAADSLHTMAWVNLGTLLGRQGRAGQAVQALDRARAIRPDDLLVQYNFGLACQKAGMTEEALEAYLMVLETDPGHVDAALNLGAIYEGTGYTAETIAVYRRALRETPTAHRLAYNLGVLQERLGAQEEAIEAYRKASEHDGERGAYALFRMAELHHRLGRIRAARTAYEQFLERWTGDEQHRAMAERRLRQP